MSREDDFKKYATEYDPIKVGSIDGTDSEPHDRAILRALRSQYTPNRLVKGDAVNTLFVGRLNPRTTEETLKAEFGKYGRILNCRVVKDIVTGKSKQYAFIEFENLGSVDRALKDMQKEYIDSAEMIVEREAERRLAGWRPRRLGGGFGGRKESGQLSTLSPDVECTWEPSQPTTARTRYYLSDRRSSPGDTGSTTTRYSKGPSTTTESLEIFNEAVEPSHEYDDVEFNSDGEPAEDSYKNQVVALVKLKPPGDMTFGCILTKITKFWTLTAASCIESIEEVDSLDSFVIMEGFGSEGASRPRTVADVRLHPQYAAAARAHDLAALRADRALRARTPPLRLPRLLDYFLVALGERFHILGYGGYRTIDKSAESRQLRQVSVFVVSSAACAAESRAELWAPRHLLRGAAVRHAACGAAPLCAGARFSRGTPCNYCAGTPLLRDHTLFGVMSDNSACGVACEPQLYVNIATLRDWIDSVIE